MKKLFFVFFLFPNLCFASCNLWSYTEPSISYYVIGPYCSQGYSGYVTENYRVDEWGGFTLDSAPIEWGSDRALLNRNIFDLHLDDPYVYGITVYADLYDLCCPKSFVMTLSVYIPNPNPPPAPELFSDWYFEFYNGVLTVNYYWYIDSIDSGSWSISSGSFQKLVNGVWLPIEGLQDIDGIWNITDFEKLPCGLSLRFVGTHANWPETEFVSPTFTRSDFAFVDVVDEGFPLPYDIYAYTEKYYNWNYQEHILNYSLDFEILQGYWNYFTGTEVFEKIGSSYQSIPPTSYDESIYDVWNVPLPFSNRKFKFEIPIESVSYSLGFNITDRCQLIGSAARGGGRKGIGSQQRVIDHKFGGAYERQVSP